jgi:predicted Na+-dependent transporter
MALFKSDSGVVEFKPVMTPFIFFHYSFETMFFTSIRELAPVDTISYIANMMQKMFSVLLIPIFVSQIITVQKQRFTEELENVIKRIESASVVMEKFIIDEYRVSTIEDALTEIERLESRLVHILLFLTERLKY